MTFKNLEQILDKATLWTFLDGQLPNFSDIGRALDRNFWKLAPQVSTGVIVVWQHRPAEGGGAGRRGGGGGGDEG